MLESRLCTCSLAAVVLGNQYACLVRCSLAEVKVVLEI